MSARLEDEAPPARSGIARRAVASARLPYATPIAGLYSGSAGCHPAGSVIGAAGHNAAERVLRDLGKA